MKILVVGLIFVSMGGVALYHSPPGVTPKSGFRSQPVDESSLDKDWPVRVHRLGVSLINSNPTDPETQKRGLALLEQAVKLDPDNPSYQLDLADSYFREGSDTAILLAMEIYESLLVTEKMHDAILARLAYCYAELDNFEAAMAVASRRIEDPKSKAFPVAAQILEFSFDSGELDLGKDYLQYLIKQRPKEPEANFLLATLLKQEGKEEEAEELIKLTARKLPQDSPFQRAAAEAVKGVRQ